VKIQIIGYSGSGKSTLAKKLSEFYNIPRLYLDTLKYYGNWEERSREDIRKDLQFFLDNNDSWVIDGNYSSVCPSRFEESDITIYLNYNRFFCYRMCKKRYKMYKDVPRESCNCKEKLDKQFKRWILWEGRTNKVKKKHLDNLNKTKGQKLIFKNRKELNKWLEEIGCVL
jgi:adenylate kinase family enzyme